MSSFSLAHLSDLHLPMDGIRFRKRQSLSKRALSHLSWHLKRRKRHLAETVSALIDDIAAVGPAHVAVTGDIVNTSRPEEFERSLPWLRRLGPAREVTLVPGNHDALVPLAHAQGLGLWQDWTQGDADPASLFPFVRRRGPVAIVGVNSALPTSIFSAAGRVGAEQAARLETSLERLKAENLFRVVLVHHPVADGLQPPRKALSDRALLQEVFARSGAELILHGHTHRASLTAIDGPKGPIPVIGVPSASGAEGHRDYAARWHLYEIAQDGAGWRLTVTARKLEDGRFQEAGRYVLALPAA